MNEKRYVLFEGGGRKVRGFDQGKLVEVRYFELVPTDIAAPDRDEFIDLVEDQRLTSDELAQIRVACFDDKGDRKFFRWSEFIDMQPQTA